MLQRLSMVIAQRTRSIRREVPNNLTLCWLVNSFPWVSNQVKVFNLGGTFFFHINFHWESGNSIPQCHSTSWKTEKRPLGEWPQKQESVMFDRRDIKDLLNGLRHKNIMKFIHVQIAIRDILRKSLTKIHLAKRNAGHRKERLITYPNISPEFHLATISKSPSQTSLKHLWAIQNSFPGTGSSTRRIGTSLKISPRYFFLIKSAWSFFQNLQLAFASMAFFIWIDFLIPRPLLSEPFPIY